MERFTHTRIARPAALQIELQIVYLEEHTTPSTYVMPNVISVEVQFGADIPPKLIQVRATPLCCHISSRRACGGHSVLCYAA